MHNQQRQITKLDELEALYGLPSGGAVSKEVDYITEAYPYIQRCVKGVTGTS